MPTELEVRMHAAGDEIDRQIARRAIRRPLRPLRPARRPVWTLVVAASAGALLMAGLVWLTADDTAGRPASPGPAPSEVVVPSVTVAPTVAPTVPITTPATNFPSSTVPYDQRPPIAVGESVMLGAVPQLHVGGFAVYAEESHQADWVVGVVGQLRAYEQIGNTIVIQTGTNGQLTAEQLDAIMALLPAEEVPQVVFLTVRAPKPWIDGNNELIRALPAKYPNQVKVLEWKGLVDSDQIPGIAGDGVHLGTVAAKQAYANYIFDTIGRRDLVLPVE